MTTSMTFDLFAGDFLADFIAQPWAPHQGGGRQPFRFQKKSTKRLTDTAEQVELGVLDALRDARRAPTQSQLEALAARVAQQLEQPPSQPPVSVRAAALRTNLASPQRLAILGLSLVVGALLLWWSLTPKSPDTGAPAPAPKPALSAVPEPARQAQSARAEMQPAPAASAPDQPAAAPVHGSHLGSRTLSAKTSTTPARTLADEMALLHGARRALLARPERTLLLCTQHAREYPESLFAEEREALVVEALFNAARRADAQAQLRLFARQHPHSTYRTRLERLLGSPSP